jgi:hypothetical protein
MVEPKAEVRPSFWEDDVEHPAGGLWRVRTHDLQEAPMQMPNEMVKAIVGNRGRFWTTVYGPDGGQYKSTLAPSRTEAEEFHRRMIERISQGQL